MKLILGGSLQVFDVFCVSKVCLGMLSIMQRVELALFLFPNAKSFVAAFPFVYRQRFASFTMAHNALLPR
jgi:hypothetical protein